MEFYDKLQHFSEKIYDTFHLKYFVPFFLLLIYTCAGAAVLYGFEGHHETEMRKQYQQDYAYAEDQIMRRLVEIKWDPGINESELVYNRTLEAVDWYKRYLRLDQMIVDKLTSNSWTWWGSMFYCGTIYSTIGYGLPSPTTTAGRLFTCVYALIGIPFFLTILKEVGIHLGRLLRRAWKSGKKTVKRIRRKFRHASQAVRNFISRHFGTGTGPNQKHSLSKDEYANLEEGLNQSKSALVNLEDGDKSSSDQQKKNGSSTTGGGSVLQIMSTSQVSAAANKSHQITPRKKSRLPFPIYLPLILVVIWIILCAGIFCIWERDWGFFTSAYFVFISLSTIGLGDVVPSKPDLMLANFFLLMIGLTLISMSFALIQIRIEELLEDMLQKFIEDFEHMGIGEGKFDLGLSNEYQKRRSPGWITKGGKKYPLSTTVGGGTLKSEGSEDKTFIGEAEGEKEAIVDSEALESPRSYIVGNNHLPQPPVLALGQHKDRMAHCVQRRKRRRIPSFNILEHLAKAVAPRHRSVTPTSSSSSTNSASSSSSAEDDPFGAAKGRRKRTRQRKRKEKREKKQANMETTKTPVEQALHQWVIDNGGSSGELLYRIMNTHQLTQLQSKVAEKQREFVTISVQTVNDFTDIIHFLDIPDKAPGSIQSSKVNSWMQTDISVPSLVSMQKSEQMLTSPVWLQDELRQQIPAEKLHGMTEFSDSSSSSTSLAQNTYCTHQQHQQPLSADSNNTQRPNSSSSSSPCDDDTIRNETEDCEHIKHSFCIPITTNPSTTVLPGVHRRVPKRAFSKDNCCCSETQTNIEQTIPKTRSSPAHQSDRPKSYPTLNLDPGQKKLCATSIEKTAASSSSSTNKSSSHSDREVTNVPSGNGASAAVILNVPDTAKNQLDAPNRLLKPPAKSWNRTKPRNRPSAANHQRKQSKQKRQKPVANNKSSVSKPSSSTSGFSNAESTNEEDEHLLVSGGSSFANNNSSHIRMGTAGKKPTSNDQSTVEAPTLIAAYPAAEIPVKFVDNFITIPDASTVKSVLPIHPDSGVDVVLENVHLGHLKPSMSDTKRGRRRNDDQQGDGEDDSLILSIEQERRLESRLPTAEKFIQSTNSSPISTSTSHSLLAPAVGGGDGGAGGDGASTTNSSEIPQPQSAISEFRILLDKTSVVKPSVF